MTGLSRSVTHLSDITVLSQISLFRNLTNAHQAQISQSLHRKAFPAGSMLMNAGQMGESVYFILSGTVKVHVEQESGADVIMAILGPGDIVGEICALDAQGRSASVVTLEPSDLMWVDRATFHRYLAVIPAISCNLACILAERLRQANSHIQSLAAHETECRIARRILGFAERYGQSLPNGDIRIPIRLTQSDIAALVGASREHTNKILVSYKDRGYLSVDAMYHITIHDRNALARRCG
jgi:CRP/FNR family cyclic AMP-dependent transcriptional regulator